MPCSFYYNFFFFCVSACPILDKQTVLLTCCVLDDCVNHAHHSTYVRERREA